MFKQVLNLFNKKRLQILIDNAPGPSPWYLSGRMLHSGLRWEDAGKEAPLIGKMVLKTHDDKILMVLDLYCYTLELKSNKLLIWYEQLAKTAFESGLVHFHVIELDKLEPIEDVTLACKSINRLYYKGGDAIIFKFKSLNEGKHQIDLSASIKELDELLILAHTKSGNIKQENLAIYRLLPNENLVEVLPQDWFNAGNFDYGYQWVTRVVRNDTTQKICGDGIRMGSFILDPTNRQVERWL